MSERGAADDPAFPSPVALFLLFLRIGALGFGGPVAQIALIRRVLVEERRWVTLDRFNKLLAVMQVLPGPEAHELCVHLGVRAGGRIGGLLAGLGFMLPGLVLMLIAAALYARLAEGSALVGAALLGVQATVLAVIVRAVHRIGAHVLVDRAAFAIAVASGAAVLAGVSFWVVLTAAGLVNALTAERRWRLLAATGAAAVLAGLAVTKLHAAGGEATPLEATSAALFVAGLKGGLLTFGGAYTAIPFVRADTVGRGWLSEAQFLDGVGLAHTLPAPLVVFATFAGWVSGGLAGALAITAGMFLPAFALPLIFYERLEAVLDNPRLQGVLSGVASAVVGMVAVTAVQLALEAAGRTPGLPVSAALFAAALVVVYGWTSKLSALAAVVGGAAAGALLLR